MTVDALNTILGRETFNIKVRGLVGCKWWACCCEGGRTLYVCLDRIPGLSAFWCWAEPWEWQCYGSFRIACELLSD